MIYFLCKIFDGCQVDGIHFQFMEFHEITSFQGRQMKLNYWKCQHMHYGADRMMDEHMRVTNIAFGVKCSTPPVFLLDDIQMEAQILHN